MRGKTFFAFFSALPGLKSVCPFCPGRNGAGKLARKARKGCREKRQIFRNVSTYHDALMYSFRPTGPAPRTRARRTRRDANRFAVLPSPAWRDRASIRAREATGLGLHSLTFPLVGNPANPQTRINSGLSASHNEHYVQSGPRE